MGFNDMRSVKVFCRNERPLLSYKVKVLLEKRKRFCKLVDDERFLRKKENHFNLLFKDHDHYECT